MGWKVLGGGAGGGCGEGCLRAAGGEGWLERGWPEAGGLGGGVRRDTTCRTTSGVLRGSAAATEGRPPPTGDKGVRRRLRLGVSSGMAEAASAKGNSS